MRPDRFNFAIFMALMLVASFALRMGPHCLGEEPATPDWKTGGELKQQLASRVSLGWENAPLARALASVAKSQQIAILRDRRIDPGLPLTWSAKQQPLSSVLQGIAEHLKIGYTQLGPLAYFGPPSTTARLRTVAALRLQEVRQLPAEQAARCAMVQGWHWLDLSEPRTMIETLLREADVSVENLERIPHDVWPAGEFPPLSWCDRLTLLLAQFDLTWQFEDQGRRIKLVDMPAEVTLTRTFPGGRNAKELARRWGELVPEAKIEIDGSRIRVVARSEELERIEARQRVAPSRRTKTPAGQQAYQLAVQGAALSKVVTQLGERLGLEFEWETQKIEMAGISPDQLVSVDVQNVDLDDLLKAVFADTGLTYSRKGRAIVIRPGAVRGAKTNRGDRPS